jgi:hypothetical protein
MKSDQTKRQLMSLRELDMLKSGSVSVAIWQAIGSRYYLVTRHLLQSKLFLRLYNFPMQKATTYSSEIASKEPNVCKKIYC